MRLKGYANGRPRQPLSLLHRFNEKGLVAEMDAVKVADGDRPMTANGRNLGIQCLAEDGHEVNRAACAGEVLTQKGSDPWLLGSDPLF